ncbi:MAG: TetR/AcrR family transcriptional regulator [Deltaproteobacteria bacterium]|nr:TetR/AcrR family transcriptional regulator [Deltaproteobacteria bacterium]
MTTKKAPELRKEEIFNAALFCFNQKGYYETSIDDIAARAGITKGGIYHHFNSKKTLFIDLFHTVANRYFESLKLKIHQPSNASSHMQHLVKKSNEIFDENMDILKFCFEFMSLASRDSEIRLAVTDFYKNRVAIFAETLSDGVNRGMFKDIPADAVARSLYFLSMGFFLTYFTVDIDFDPMTQHTINMKTFMEGIKKQ